MKGFWVVNDEIYDFKKNQLNLFSPDSKVDTDITEHSLCLFAWQCLGLSLSVSMSGLMWV